MLAVLSRLQVPQYGYSLKQALLEGGLPVEEGTLYPLLRRLETQGLLASEWNTGHAPPRRYYRITALGRAVLEQWIAAWTTTRDFVDSVLESNSLQGAKP